MKPAIENLKVQEQTVRLYVDMNLASVPVTVIGQYNIHSNSFYPQSIFPTLKIVDVEKVIAECQSYSLDEFCELMGWDADVWYEIQEAVEKRNQ